MNDMRKLMEAVEEGMFAPDKGPLDKDFYKHKKGTNYADVAQKYKMQISIPAEGYFGISWVGEDGSDHYEEKSAEQISSMDAMVEFALSEMGIK
jgi:hypothetical protein